MRASRTGRCPISRKPIWKLERHTAAKHELLRRYLGAWFPIIASSGFRQRIVFIDGFAGPGIYRDGEAGSPIIALRTLLDHPQFSRWRKNEFVFALFEPDADRWTSLQQQINALKASYPGDWPSNVKIHVEQTTFESATQEILESLDGKNLAPTFAFVDPFGFSGAPIALLARLLAFDSCEVFFTFIADHVNRFVGHENETVRGHMDALFGTKEHQKARALAGEERLQFLHDLYSRQLRDVGGFTYVASFRMLNERGKTPSWLFYGTRRIEGLKKMKDAMWKVDPGSGVQFADRLAGQEVLFAGDRLDVAPLRKAIVARFVGEQVSVNEVEKFVLVETPFAASHYNQQILKPLEDEGLIEVVESTRTRRGTFPPGTHDSVHGTLESNICSVGRVGL